MAKAFCLQCGVRGFDDLRLGCNLADLVSAAAEKQEQQPKVSVIGAAALLASCSPCNDIMGLGGGSVSCDTAAVGLLGEVDREAAARCLSAAPLLVDLLEWSHWTAVFQPSLGPLPEFLRSSRTTTALKLPRALATADGRLLKLPDGGGPADGFSAAIKRGCPEEAAGELLAVVIDCGSLELSPLTRLITAATAGLSARLASPPGDAASFWIRMIGLLPRELRAPMARAVLLPAFTEAAGKHHSHILLREAAEGDEASQSLLAALGLELGEAAWYNQWASQWQQSGEEGGSLTSGSHQKKHNSRAAGYGPEAVPMDLPSWLAPLPQAVTVIKGPSGEEAKDPTAAGMSDLQMKGGGLEGTTQHPDPYMGSEVDAGAGGGNLEEAKAVVEDIRKKLGILPRHKGMDEDVQRCLDEYPKLMGNACDKLSTELYSTDSHFVLELIQNADDNTYGSHVSPAVCFIVGAANSITVLNNEVRPAVRRHRKRPKPVDRTEELHGSSLLLKHRQARACHSYRTSQCSRSASPTATSRRSAASGSRPSRKRLDTLGRRASDSSRSSASRTSQACTQGAITSPST